MKRRPISPAADTLRLTKPNTTGVHLIYGPPPALRTNGLQPIGKTTSAPSLKKAMCWPRAM